MNKNIRNIIAVLAIVGFGALIYISNSKQDQQAANPATGQPAQGRAIVEVTVPALEGEAVLGQLAFVAKCASCHGENAVGASGRRAAACAQNLRAIAPR